MLVNFGLRGEFRWDDSYVLPVGAVAASQWAEIKRDRYGHMADLVGRAPRAFTQSFERNYAQPLIDACSNVLEGTSEKCTCQTPAPAYLNAEEGIALPSDSGVRVLPLFDLYDIVRNTNMLPVLSPLFHPKSGLTPAFDSQSQPKVFSVACDYCKKTMNVIHLDRSGATRTQVGVASMRRAPHALLTRSLLGRGYEDAEWQLRQSNIPRGVRLRATKKFARMVFLAGGYEGFDLMPWDSRRIDNDYWSYERRLKNPDDAALLVLLQMAAYDNNDFYPTQDECALFKDEPVLKLLVRHVIRASQTNAPRYHALKENKRYRYESNYGSFHTLTKFTLAGVDVDLISSLTGDEGF
jgi:hypothetical protein